MAAAKPSPHPLHRTLALLALHLQRSQHALEGIRRGLDAVRPVPLPDGNRDTALFNILTERFKVESEAIAAEAQTLFDLSADPKLRKVYQLSEKLAPRSERSA